MKVQVKVELKKTIECNLYDIKNKVGECVQVLGDGYCLIEFNVLVEDRKQRRDYLQWYVHDTDFYIKQ